MVVSSADSSWATISAVADLGMPLVSASTLGSGASSGFDSGGDFESASWSDSEIYRGVVLTTVLRTRFFFLLGIGGIVASAALAVVVVVWLIPEEASVSVVAVVANAVYGLGDFEDDLVRRRNGGEGVMSLSGGKEAIVR